MLGPHVVKTHTALVHSAIWSAIPSDYGDVGALGVGTVEGAGAGIAAFAGGGEGSELVFASATLVSSFAQIACLMAWGRR